MSKGKNKSIKEQFEQLHISGKTFQAGEIYITKDEKVLFPSRKTIEEKPRLVLVLGQNKDLNDPMLPHLSVIPITGKFELQTDQDLELEKGVGNLKKQSLVKAGMVQPMLKIDLDRSIGKIDGDSLDEIKAMVFVNLGLAEDE